MSWHEAALLRWRHETPLGPGRLVSSLSQLFQHMQKKCKKQCQVTESSQLTPAMANLTCMGYESRTKNCYNCITCSIKRRQMSCSNHLKSSFKFPSGNHLQLALVILWHRTEIICYVCCKFHRHLQENVWKKKHLQEVSLQVGTSAADHWLATSDECDGERCDTDEDIATGFCAIETKLD